MGEGGEGYGSGEAVPDGERRPSWQTCRDLHALAFESGGRNGCNLLTSNRTLRAQGRSPSFLAGELYSGPTRIAGVGILGVPRSLAKGWSPLFPSLRATLVPSHTGSDRRRAFLPDRARK